MKKLQLKSFRRYSSKSLDTLGTF